MSKLTVANRANYPQYTAWSSTGANSVLDISSLENLTNINITESNGGRIIYYTSNRLILSVASTIIPENIGNQTATITRNGDLSEALTVYLTSSNTTALTVPQNVTIAAGESSASFWITVIHDELTTLNRTAIVTYVADNFIERSLQLTIADVDKINGVPYTATVSASVIQASVGTPVVLSGSATLKNGQPATFAEIDVHLFVRNFERIIRVTTDNEGNFSTTFAPLPNESGRYTVFACHPTISWISAQTTFDLVGMRVENTSLSLKLVEGTPQSRSLTLSNLGDVPLTGLTAQAINLPGNLNISCSWENSGDTLTGFGTKNLTIYVETLDTSIRSGMFMIRIGSNETVNYYVQVSFSVEALVPKLQADVSRVGTVAPQIWFMTPANRCSSMRQAAITASPLVHLPSMLAATP